MVDLSKRENTPEIMDDLHLPDSDIVPVLKGLAKVNHLFGGHRSMIDALEDFPVLDGDVISDWGCGGGDALIAIADWAEEKYIKLNLIGIDAAPAAIKFARQSSLNHPGIKYIQADVLSTSPKSFAADIVITSLFTHHFGDDEWVRLIKNMYASSRRGIIITDLHRHWLLYYSVIFIANVFTKSRLVRNDGPLSVKRSFKKAELISLIKKTGIINYKITWMWAFRWKIVIYKS